MISAFLNTVKIPELRRRILFTLAIIVIVRLGAAITTPGVNQAVLQEWFRSTADKAGGVAARSEEHTSELQSRFDLVCRLLLPPPLCSTLFPYTTLFRSFRK